MLLFGWTGNSREQLIQSCSCFGKFGLHVTVTWFALASTSLPPVLCDVHLLPVQAMIEQLMQEWRVGDFAVAESIFKARKRQLKQKGGAQLRQKMQVRDYCRSELANVTQAVAGCA